MKVFMCAYTGIGQVADQAGAYPVSVAWSGKKYFYSTLDGMVVHHKATPLSISHQHLIVEVNSHIYCPGCVLCLSWEHNISSMPWVQTWTTNSLNWPVLIININFLCSHRHLGTFKLKGTVTSLHRKLTQCANVWVLKLGHKCIKVHENKNIHDSQFVMKLLIALQFQK